MALQMIAVSADEFARWRARLTAVTADQIMAVYGVSETTWRKIRKGVPVRYETLDRMRTRYRQMTPAPNGIDGEPALQLSPD